jgi:hypothetical protein
MSFKTKIASLASYEKGTIELNDDLKHYAFSNIFEVANMSKPYERVLVASNLEYAGEVVRAEGTSPWYTAPHDEFAIVFPTRRRRKALSQAWCLQAGRHSAGQTHGQGNSAPRP